jgi:hypothetical protein
MIKSISQNGPLRLLGRSCNANGAAIPRLLEIDGFRVRDLATRGACTSRDSPHRLPARQREALVLRYHEDLPLQEIASTLGIAVNATSAALSRALESISKAIGADR